MIEILTSGALNLVQDLGRHGFLHLGVSRSGAMDDEALRLGNALLGNPDNAAGVEICVFPFKVRFKTTTWFTCTGADSRLSLDGKPVPGWWRCQAQAGQTLMVERPIRGVRAYLCVGAGIDVEPIMGSRSTDLKAAFGGFAGRGLKRGDCLPVAQGAAFSSTESFGIAPFHRRNFWQELEAGQICVRALPAAEYGLFTAQARDAFINMPFSISAQSNRIGYRLTGESLALGSPVELRSHGILPGTVQVPPAGQPIVQMAEANTCGGYPKIANVIEPDLWRLAQAPIGTPVRFILISQTQALEALRLYSGVAV
ncbi:MAG TPA: biotin-dependent carboxyltransferase family protein [Pseudomonas sp.]|uniref:5-oxoprolinase subunit C family protein n=1 Tax=Pseudomonas sp. TaxID=306 RepID=UPI002EDAA1C3